MRDNRDMPPKNLEKIQSPKILVVPLRFIGDTVVSVPLVRNLRYAYPQARIDVLVNTLTRSLLDPCPYVASLMIEPETASATQAMLKREKYDAVFILRKSVTMAMMCKMAGTDLVVGYDKQRYPFGYKRWGLFLDKKAKYPSLKTTTPQVQNHLSLLRACDIPVVDDHLELWARPEDEAMVSALLMGYEVDESAPLAVVHAMSGSHGKTLDSRKFRLAVEKLLDAGYAVAATGGAKDAHIYKGLHPKLINLAGKTSLRETYALYKRTQFLVTVDSAPLHLAAAAGVPNIVGVFGPTNEKQWRPYNTSVNFKPVFIDMPCRPCYAKVCSHNNCRMQMTPEQIAQGVIKLLEK